MTTLIGVLASILSIFSLAISIKRGYDGDYNRSHKAELICAVWLIVALICFK